MVDHLNPICVLINECQKPSCHVADSTQMWLTLVLPSEEFDNLFDERVKKAIWPVGYAANILHNQYKGALLNAEQRQIVFCFIQDYFDENVIYEYNYYINHLEEFQEFAGQCDNPITYWTFLEMRFINLCKCAKSLMLITSINSLDRRSFFTVDLCSQY